MSRKMNFGIKVSKQGFDVTNLDNDQVNGLPNQQLLPHLLYSLALPYLFGAKKQVERYQVAFLTLQKTPVRCACECLHEVSALFEDLNTVGKYVEMCKKENEQHKLWLDVRNHIRHDVREEYGKEGHKSKNGRAKRLKLNSKLQTNIGFAADAIKIGEVVIEIQQIKYYLEWAEKIIFEVLNNAKRDGYLKQ